MGKKSIILVLIAIVIAVPLCLKKKSVAASVPTEKTDERLVIITPHNESIRFEMARGFQQWYFKHTGKTVFVDWRVPGSTGEVLKYVDALYVNAFRLHWERMGKTWSQRIKGGFVRPLSPDSPEEVRQAREAFLASNVGCGIDLLFGGGVAEFIKEANMGQLVSSGLLESKPELFTDEAIPYTLAGDHLWDKEGRWIGTTLSGFGIVFNRDRLVQLGFHGEPNNWDALTDPCFLGQVAFVDPAKSSAIITSMEMMIQQKMQARLKALCAENPDADRESLEGRAVADGWIAAMRMIQKIIANSRYFSDASTRTILDVVGGNCAIGVLLDFYARAQEHVQEHRGSSARLGYILPPGGTCPSPDPIGLLRGAPNLSVAKAFIEYVISYDGQKVIDFKVGTPGGPVHYPINRTPIRKDFCEDPSLAPYRLNPDINPFRDTAGFSYKAVWTKPIYGLIRFVTKAAFIDAHKELAAAWSTIIEAKREGRMADYNRALAIFEDISLISYDQIVGPIKKTVEAKNPLREIQMQTQIANHFREQFKRASSLAKGGH